MIQIGKEPKSPPILAVTGKTMQAPWLTEDKSKKRLNSPEMCKRLGSLTKPNRLEKTMQNYLASGISFISQKRNSTALIRELSKTALKKVYPKNIMGESFEAENNSKIYKCMSNPNVNGNSNTYGNPIRAITASNENTIIYKHPPIGPYRIPNTPKLTKLKVIQKKVNLIHVLQKCNGIQCKETEDGIFRYFIGLGNNSQLVNQIMKSRTRWKKVHTHVSANFIWTAVKKNSIFDYLGSTESTLEKSISTTPTQYPQILPQENYCQILPLKMINPGRTRVYNKLSENRELTSKKRLFYNMYNYYTLNKVNPFIKIPLTFHVLYGSYDAVFKTFLAKYNEIQQSGESNIWIIKPGEGTNRGVGITVCKTLEQITNFINSYDTEDERTYVIQKYVDNPLLYKSRKFDIRCYALVTSFQGNIQCFFYKEGYLRTSSADYSVTNIENKFIHLTNDAVQKYSSSYGKHEAGNKLSYAEFQEYLIKNDYKVDFYKDMLPQIKDIVKDTILATFSKIDPERKAHSFEILGYDFLIDSNFHVWLIEVNTNPCLELSSPYLEILIPRMLDHAFALTIDQLFPNEISPTNDFELIFNEALTKY